MRPHIVNSECDGVATRDGPGSTGVKEITHPARGRYAFGTPRVDNHLRQSQRRYSSGVFTAQKRPLLTQSRNQPMILAPATSSGTSVNAAAA